MGKQAELNAQVPLPVRDGVAPSYLWLDVTPDLPALAYLTQRFPDVGAAVWRNRMARGDVVDGAGVRIGPDSALQRGARLWYYREIDAETPIPFAERVVFEDDDLLVADKPHFLPTMPGGRFLHETLLVRLKLKTGCAELTPIHRLDRETAGIVLFSKREQSRGAYQSLFQQRSVQKEYEALAPYLALDYPLVYQSRMLEGIPFFRMQEVAGEPNSETRIDIIERRGELALYRLQPHTGRKHQLRLHMAALGAPIVNDVFYPEAQPDKGDDFTSPLKLLARSIAFTDPLTGEARQFASMRSL